MFSLRIAVVASLLVVSASASAKEEKTPALAKIARVLPGKVRQVAGHALANAGEKELDAAKTERTTGKRYVKQGQREIAKAGLWDTDLHHVGFAHEMQGERLLAKAAKKQSIGSALARAGANVLGDKTTKPSEARPAPRTAR